MATMHKGDITIWLPSPFWRFCGHSILGRQCHHTSASSSLPTQFSQLTSFRYPEKIWLTVPPFQPGVSILNSSFQFVCLSPAGALDSRPRRRKTSWERSSFFCCWQPPGADWNLESATPPPRRRHRIPAAAARRCWSLRGGWQQHPWPGSARSQTWRPQLCSSTHVKLGGSLLLFSTSSCLHPPPPPLHSLALSICELLLRRLSLNPNYPPPTASGWSSAQQGRNPSDFWWWVATAWLDPQELRRRGRSCFHPGQALRDLNTKVILPLRSHPWLSYTAIKPLHFTHKEGCALQAKLGFWQILISPSISQIFKALHSAFWGSDYVLVCRLWSSFASNADKEAHAQRWQKHGEDFWENDLRQCARKVSCPVENGLHHFSWQGNRTRWWAGKILLNHIPNWTLGGTDGDLDN